MGSADPLVGSVIGNYRIVGLLGEGGMGRVYLATQPHIHARAAIKVLTSQQPDLVARFFAEANAVNVINHPSIVKVFDLAHLPDGRPYIIMELVEGETLRTLIKRESPLPLGGVIRIVTDVLGALEAAHRKQIVHRDLKPDNVMVVPGGGAKVLDFGIAKLTALGDIAAARTQTGARIGTPGYMAPEQIRGGTVDARTDIYAMGVLLFEAVCGTRPFNSDIEFDLMRGHLEEAPPSPRSLRRDVPPLLEDVILQALAKRQDDRFDSASAMARALAQVLPQLGGEQLSALTPRPEASMKMLAVSSAEQATVDERSPRAPSVVAAPPPARVASAVALPRRVSRHRWFIAGGTATAVLAVVAVGAYAMSRKGSSTEPAPTKITLGSAAPVAPPPLPPPVSESPSGIKQSRKPLDVDPAAFDAVAYVPQARVMAQALVPGVELQTMQADAVASTGIPLLDGPTAVYYMFSLPDQPLQSPTNRLCLVVVAVRGTEVNASVTPSPVCPAPEKRVPTCSLGSLWSRALAKGAETSAIAKLQYAMGTWTFMTTSAGSKAVRLQLEDNCAAPTSTPTAVAKTGKKGVPPGQQKKTTAPVEPDPDSAGLSKGLDDSGRPCDPFSSMHACHK